MEDDRDPADVFAVPDFWKPSKYVDTSLDESNAFFSPHLLNVPVIIPRGPSIKNGFFVAPPDLDDLACPEPRSPVTRKACEDTRLQSHQPIELEEDFWLDPGTESKRQAEYKTWEAFERSGFGKAAPAFISELGASALDAYLKQSPTQASNGSSLVIDTDTYCGCLVALALGRGSVLFKWSPAKRSFLPTAPRTRISGFSVESLSDVNDMCLECANSVKFLRSFVDRTFSSAPSSCRVALAGAVHSLLMAIESELGFHGQRVRSVLQLRHVVQPVLAILTYFRGLIEKLAGLRTDEEILSFFFEAAQSAENRPGALRDLLRHALQLVSKPWTDFVEEWIGLKKEQGIVVTKNGAGKSFVKVDNKMRVGEQGFDLEQPDYFLDEDKMPSFVPEDMALSIFETGRNLRFLRRDHADEAVSDHGHTSAANPPELRWLYYWNDIKQLERKSLQYERTLNRAPRSRSMQTVATHQTSPPTAKANELGFFGQDAHEIEANFLAFLHKLDKPPASVPGSRFLHIIQNQLFGQDATPRVPELSPHWSLLPLLSFGPIIAAQARLINRACMRLLFRFHGLRDHLDMQKQYHLLGNGVFLVQLSHALFDPDLDTAERKAGVAFAGGNMGLRLNGGRDIWPPASSELRLTLLGLLGETYQPRVQRLKSQGAANDKQAASDHNMQDMLGCLSFAVRDLLPAEMDRCVEPHGLEALDFLRLVYHPPSALRPILTPFALGIYDRLFRLLLRVLRMLYAVRQLFTKLVFVRITDGDKDASDGDSLGMERRFMFEARLLITQLAGYFFGTGIEGPWRRFEAWLDGVEAGLDADDNDDNDDDDDDDKDRSNWKTPVAVAGPENVRERHERCLDEILHALLLRRRQAPVLKLMEDIFGVVLKLSQRAVARRQRRRCSKTRKDDDGRDEEGSVPSCADLYSEFRKKVEVFVAVCRGLGERTGGKNVFERLADMVDSAHHYSKR